METFLGIHRNAWTSCCMLIPLDFPLPVSLSDEKTKGWPGMVFCGSLCC